MIETFITGAIVAFIFLVVPRLWRLGKEKKQEAIWSGKVYYGLLYYRIPLLYLFGFMSAELILMVLLGDSVDGETALTRALVLGVPFALLYIFIYRAIFKKRHL